jgi:subtilisin
MIVINPHHSRRSYLSLLGLLAALLCYCLPTDVDQAAAQDAPEEPAADLDSREAFAEPSADALLFEAQQYGRVKIIVKLAMAFRAEGEWSSVQDVMRQRTAIVQGQTRLLRTLLRHRITDIKPFRYVPYLAMTVDQSALMELLNQPGIIRIFKDELLPPVLAESVPLIHADDVWAPGITGSGWTVAILDSGVDQTHLFLNDGKVVSEACYSTTDASQRIFSLCPNGQTSQEGFGAGANCPANIEGCEHGTHVAGIAAGHAADTPRPDLNGVAKDASIIAIQVFSRVDNSSLCSQFRLGTPCVLTAISDQMRGLERILELRQAFQIAAVNMSLGGGRFTSPCDAQSALTEQLQNLRSVNIATVVASGNSGFSDALGSPACISTAISVGNTTKSDAIASSSNSASFLSLLASGTQIVSSTPNNGLAALTGTSMAAPHVTGAFALLRQAKPSAAVGEILQALQGTGVPITDPRNGITIPRIDVKAAFDALIGSGTPALTNPTPGSTLPGSTATFQWTANGAPVLEWGLYIGSSPGSSDRFNSGSLGTQLSLTVNGLPTDGRQLFVRLWFRLPQGWQAADFPYIAASSGGDALALGTFQGTITTTIAALHPGTGGILDLQTFSKNVDVFVGQPAAAGGLVEANPVNLVIFPSASSNLGEEGQMAIFSAFPFAFNDGSQLLVQYWTLALEGNHIAGSLMDNHVREALALNLINSLDLNLALVGIRSVTTLALDVQITTLTGTIDANQVRLTIQGATTDRAHWFFSEIVANRLN